MTKISKPLLFLLLSVISFSIAYITENLNNTKRREIRFCKNFQENILQTQKLLKNEVESFANSIAKEKAVDIYIRNHRIVHHLSNTDIMLLAYKGKELVFWSDNRLPEAEHLYELDNHNDLVKLSNGYFLVCKAEISDYLVMGLCLIRNAYPFENRYLSNTYSKLFNMPNESILSLDNSRKGFTIYNDKSKYLCSVEFPKGIHTESANQLLSIIFYLLSLGFLLFLIYFFIGKISKPSYKILAVILTAGLLIILKYLLVLFRFPGAIYDMDIFQPVHYAASNLLPSFGDLMFASIIAFYIALIVKNHLGNLIKKLHSRTAFDLIIQTVGFSLLIIYFIFLNKLFENIIYNSSINFEIRDLLSIKYYTFIGFIVIGLFFLSFILLADFLIAGTYFDEKPLILIIKFLTLLILIFFINYILSSDFKLATPLILFFTFCLVVLIKNYYKSSYRYSQVILLIFFFSLYADYTIIRISSLKKLNDKKVMAVNLASEHDPVAEYLLVDLSKNVLSDTQLHYLLFTNKFSYTELVSYLKKRYFYGYWEKYNIQITLCQPFDSVLIRPDNVFKPCYMFFDEMLGKKANPIPSTLFHYLNNANGRISYFGKIPFSENNPYNQKTLFIQMESRLITDDLGYPELLLDNKYWKSGRLSGYSYARYYKNRLIAQYGSFNYSLNNDRFPRNKLEFAQVSFGGYDHLIYRSGKENFVVLSHSSLTLFDIIVSFSYLFVFYFLLTNFIIIISRIKFLRINLTYNFKNKIQFSIIGLLIISLLTVGSVSVWYGIRQSKNKQYEIVSDKLQSVYLELESHLQNEDFLNDSWSSYEFASLEELLQKLSNIFYTDINLYDSMGQMIASSRPEVFQKGLMGTRMNAEAYFQLASRFNSEYTTNEKIGNLKFFSIYTPFLNTRDQLLAYLNLPYFARQNEFTEELSALLFSIINFYLLLLFIAVSIGVFISERITYPLRMLQNKFANITLGEKNEKIVYVAKDEIGDLVSEYNRMVDELAGNVELLARSERESAWREMAKQVAHEIKNPLTPMKLNIQHLQKAWKDKAKNFDELIIKLSRTLIEQIDNLSTIATEFSDFAKIPKPKNEKLDLGQLIKNVIDLFSESGIEFHYHFVDENTKYLVYGDKEQLKRVFINLFTNSIEAIPSFRKGEISIWLGFKAEKVAIEIKDNGIGIPDNMKDKLFEPNFTTKSGGMGLGLAIVKNIVENSGGSITYTTQQDKGTSFIVVLPKYLE
jgi:signal transduction histidine kinase